MRVYVAASLEQLATWAAAGAVPAGGERFVAEQEDEETEYDALMAAADASRELGAPRRVVVVAECADPDAAVPFDRVVAVHADPAGQATVDGDLAWYAPQEIPALLAS
ncbi:DUF6912 family protein [Nocardioides terrisoli]|uniref:DUF6912 family protein n=1 Tax=Nocardioides terrisoli TaxID=3388267 RepID=UPI00287BA5C7|nr:hypothetical protein [Nocardioides marmorisolisilvae]